MVYKKHEVSRFMETLNVLSSRRGGGYVSGQEIADEMGVTRESVSNYIEKLRGLGYKIETAHAHGSKLISEKPLGKDIDAKNLRYGLWGHIAFYRNYHVHKLIASTNTEAVRLALDDAPEGTLVVADAQSGGKGRLGRSWASPPGLNIYVSIILRPIIEPGLAPGLTLATGVAVYDAVKKLTGDNSDVQLKWPNDILVRGKKIAGILTEMNAELDRVNFIVVGIGLNVNALEGDFPDRLKGIATSLKIETGKNFIRAEVIGKVLGEVRKQYNVYVEDGHKKVFLEWEKRAKLKGKPVEVKMSRGKVKGIAAGLDERGALKIKTASGKLEKVYEGDLKVL